MTHTDAKFRVLLIDDDQKKLDEIVNRLGPNRKPVLSKGTGKLVNFDALKVDTLHTPSAVVNRQGEPLSAFAVPNAPQRVTEALRTLLCAEMYHRVYIDFRLDQHGGERFFGTDLLPEVKRLRPAARRILVTVQMDAMTPRTMARFPDAFRAIGTEAGIERRSKRDLGLPSRI